MDNWGKPKFAKTLRPNDSLYSGVEGLSIPTRQAFYAFATKGNFKRGTWNGCVFNKASELAQVKSFSTAAAYFNEPVEKVRKFIRAWDATASVIKTDAQATDLLKDVILAVGVVEASPVDMKSKGPRIYRVRLFTSEETRMVEELRSEIDNGAFDEVLAMMNELELV